ncbi:CHRD domain-containing protein [Pontibacter vulgaris]|uniref:CHRD domain-containing protein n=1 Tax=Pontibacter vulgaris TaxID=2905679 RepID=UPI001FA80EA8|nr:CHRD domain-containing protein [Pontibacter vulgaris]
MKTYTYAQNKLILLCLLILCALASGCGEDDDSDNQIFKDINFNNIELLGINERPPINTTGYGIMDVKFNDDNNTLDYTISWSLGNQNDRTTDMHFHGPANANSSALRVIDITGFDTDNSGTVTGSTRELTQQEEDDLRAGLWYVNIHSTTHPDGELRGQLVD